MASLKKLFGAMGLCLTLIVPAANAQPSLKQQLVGTWRLGSIINVRADGTKYELFGPSAKGILMLDADGFYSLQIMRGDWLPFGRTRMEGTPEENKNIVQSMISHFGTYRMDDKKRTIEFHIRGSSYPNWEKSVQQRSFVLLADDLSWTDPVPPTGPQSSDLRSDLVWHRAKSNDLQ